MINFRPAKEVRSSLIVLIPRSKVGVPVGVGGRSARHVKREIQLGTTLRRWKDTSNTRGGNSNLFIS